MTDPTVDHFLRVRAWAHEHRRELIAMRARVSEIGTTLDHLPLTAAREEHAASLPLEWPHPWPRPVRASLDDVAPLLAQYHHYKSGGDVGDVWVCVEDRRVVAGWVWTPPAPGAATKYAPSCPASVLALSRMVAIPKTDRAWQISKPLLWIMRHGLDRGRWPVLLTYSDKGAGHEGIAYMASRWKRGETTTGQTFEDSDGCRRSRYVRGGRRVEGLTKTGTTEITAWTHRVCPMGEEQAWMERHGWQRVRVPGKTWRSGADAYTWQWIDPRQLSLFGGAA